MPRRERRIMLGLAVFAVACAAAQSLAGLNADVLLAVPVLLVVLPLAAGHYPGAERLVRLAVRRRPTRPRAVSSPRPVVRAPRVMARGGRLIGTALAERGPPAPVLAR